MSTNQVAKGDIIDWVNVSGGAVVSGQVVRVGQCMGVALVDIASNATGAVALRGVFNVPKVSAAVIVAGEGLTWDASAGAFDDNAATPATGDVQGPPAVAMESAGNAVTDIDVMFTGVPGTVT